MSKLALEKMNRLSQVEEAIVIFIYENKKVRTNDLEKWIKKENITSHGSLYKYKKILEEVGVIEWETYDDVKPPYNEYFIAEDLHEKVEEIKLRKSLSVFFEELSYKDLSYFSFIVGEVKMVLETIPTMGYSTKEIKDMLAPGLDLFHSYVVNRIVESGNKESKSESP